MAVCVFAANPVVFVHVSMRDRVISMHICVGDETCRSLFFCIECIENPLFNWVCCILYRE